MLKASLEDAEDPASDGLDISREERGNVCRRTLEMEGGKEEEKGRTKNEMVGLSEQQPHNHRSDRRSSPRQRQLEEDHFCRSDPTSEWDKLEEEDEYLSELYLKLHPN